MSTHQQSAKSRKWPWIVGGIVLFFIIVASCGGGSDSGSAPSSSSAPAGGSAAPAAPAAPAETQEADEQTTARYGQPLTADGVTLTVATPRTSSNQFTGSQVCVQVTYQNGSDNAVSFNPFDWKFRTEEGVEASSSIPFNAQRALSSGQLSPGGRVQGQVCSDNTIEQASAVVYQPGFGLSDPLVWSAR